MLITERDAPFKVKMMKKWIHKTCEYCNKHFEVTPARGKTARFCSLSCRSKKFMGIGESARFWKGGNPKYKCLVCGKEGERKNSTGSTYKFCSTKCHDFYRLKRVVVVCKQCNNEFEMKQSHFEEGRKFCSQKCAKSFMVGTDSPHWKGGERGRKFYPKEWSGEFKRMIRERDNNTCKICGKYGKDVHHINYRKMDTTPENCITLCKGCHAKTNSNRECWVRYFQSR